ncbi:MAG: TonB-dependent receptor [Paludibacter sp.]|nr:TonB-dependent receptor [Paludibacter sp.]
MERNNHFKLLTHLQTAVLVIILLILPAYTGIYSTQAQTSHFQIKGLVVDEQNTPLPGVNIKVVGTGQGTITDINGKYSISYTNKNATLDFSYIGYESQTISVSGKTVLNIKLNPSDKVLNEVIVVGYGTQKKKDLTGSVASVGVKDFNQGLHTTSTDLINGKVAGVQILPWSGSPTSGTSIRIRGGASLNASNEPLIVVDGVPLESGGITGSGNFLSLINPNDIENITILKDASSTAIYGSRASNGVLLITTKKAVSNKLKVVFTTNSSIQTKTRTPQMLNESEFKSAVAQKGIADNTDYSSLLGDTWTNWYDLIYQPAFGTDNSLSLSGKIAKAIPFRASVGYMYQDGILKTDNYKRYTGNIQITPSFFDNKLRLNLSIKGAVNNNTYANTDAIYAATVFNPTLPVYSGSTLYGGYTQFLTNAGIPVSSAPYNPYSLLYQESHKGDINRLIGNFDVDYRVHFLPDLRMHVTLGFDAANGNTTDYISPDAAKSYFSDISGRGSYSTASQTNTNKLLSSYLNYSKELESIKSTLDATVGYDYQDWISETAVPVTMTADRDSVTYRGLADYQRHVLISYYGRIHYGFDSRYLITATLRSDGTSRFSESNRWGVFPSLAFAWNAKNESFLKSCEKIDDLKLRLGYGVTGQQDGIGNYNYLPIYYLGSSTNEVLMGNQYYMTYTPTAYASDLKWETTNAYNAGVDFAFLKRRISGSIDYYYRTTTNLIATVNAPAGTNISNQVTTNVGSLESEGVELAINGTPIQTKNFQWTLGFNGTYQHQNITSLEMAQDPGLQAGPVVTKGGQSLQILTQGYAPYMFYVRKQVYDSNGKPIEGMYADLNKDGVVDDNDFYRYHKPTPDFIFGFNTSVTWKKITLSTVLRANIGNYVYNQQKVASLADVQYMSNTLNNINKDFLNTGFVQQPFLTDYYIENASFLKMDNLTCSYDLGKIYKSVSLKVGGSVQNVFTITKYSGVDPEVSNGYDVSLYPHPRVYSVNLTLNL